jgi:flagellar biosynthesis/type III secretory pathway protein FliH
MPEPPEVPEEAVEAATRSIQADREFARREGGTPIDARMQAENAAEASAPAIRAQEQAKVGDAIEQAERKGRHQGRKQERERVREALLSEDTRREIADVAADNGDAEDIAQLVRKLLVARLADATSAFIMESIPHE